MDAWKVRREGSPEHVETPFVLLAQGLMDGEWDPSDEVMGPAQWARFEHAFEMHGLRLGQAATFHPLHFAALEGEIDRGMREGAYAYVNQTYISWRGMPGEVETDEFLRRTADSVDKRQTALHARHDVEWPGFALVPSELKHAGRKGGPVSRMSTRDG